MRRLLQKHEYSTEWGTFQDVLYVIEFDWQGDNWYYVETKHACFVVNVDGDEHFRMPGCLYISIHEVKSIMRIMEQQYELGFKHGQLGKAGEIRKALEVVE